MFISPRYRFLTSKFNFDDYSSKGSVVHPVRKHHRALQAAGAGGMLAIKGPDAELDEANNMQLVPVSKYRAKYLFDMRVLNKARLP